MPRENDLQVLPTDGFADFAGSEEDTLGSDQSLNEEPALQLDDSTDDLDDNNDTAADESTGDDQVIPDESEAQLQADEEEKPAESEAEATKADAEPNKQKDEKRDEYMENYSKRVQRRISKEVDQRKLIQSENQQLKERLESLESRFQENEAKQQQDQEKSEYEVLNTRIRNATTIKEKLLEDGDYSEVAKVDNDIMQMKIYQSKLEERANSQQYDQQGQPVQQPGQVPQGQQQVPQGQQQVPQGQQQAPQGQQQAPKIADIQRNWITNNERYGQDQFYSQFVDNVYDALLEEGYDPDEATTYEELNKRTNSSVDYKTNRFEQPAQQQPAQQQPAQQQPAQRRQAAPAPNTASTVTPSAKRSKGLTNADKLNMRNWGLDVNDESVRKEWLKNKGVA